MESSLAVVEMMRGRLSSDPSVQIIHSQITNKAILGLQRYLCGSTHFEICTTVVTWLMTSVFHGNNKFSGGWDFMAQNSTNVNFLVHWWYEKLTRRKAEFCAKMNSPIINFGCQDCVFFTSSPSKCTAVTICHIRFANSNYCFSFTGIYLTVSMTLTISPYVFCEIGVNTVWAKNNID